MSQETQNATTEETIQPVETENEATVTVEATTEENATPVENEKSLEETQAETIEAQEKQIADLNAALIIAQKNEKEAMIRARAEIDNVRKRLEQDVEKARKFVLEKFSKDLLDVVDNLERALATVNRDDEQQKPMIEGVELTLKSLLDTMNKFGVQLVDANGEMLNPELHQAITLIESPEHKTNQVVETMQKGYTLHGRLLRPAMVVVAK